MVPKSDLLNKYQLNYLSLLALKQADSKKQ